MAASNTRNCFTECIGLRVVGVLFDSLPVSRHDLAAGTKTLVFDDGTGLTMSSKGTFWRERAEDIQSAVRLKEGQLKATQAEIEGVLQVAGALAA